MADLQPSDELLEEPSELGGLAPGTRLGRYELLVPVARGGMARVWAARQHGQRGFQKLVAIKTILPHLACEIDFERMFLDEARIASGVHHPNVCEIYDLGDENRTLYLAMEWVNGDSLARLVKATGRSEALDPRIIARVVADAAAGVHAAHELTDDHGRALGVVHRDLSPHNILITADGVAKVADFGVAKALGQLHEATSAGQLKGKISYMSAEQITGSAVDRRSDVFSLGCLLYEATTGMKPFRGDSDHQVMHAILRGDVAPPSTVLRSYPPELERIVMRTLSPQPSVRFPTAERLRFALEEFLTRGQLVTQSHVGQLVHARLAEQIERRKDRIRRASNLAGVGSEPPPGLVTPSRMAVGHDTYRSEPPQPAPRPLYSTMSMAPQVRASHPASPYQPYSAVQHQGAPPPPALGGTGTAPLPPMRASAHPPPTPGPSMPPPPVIADPSGIRPAGRGAPSLAPLGEMDANASSPPVLAPGSFAPASYVDETPYEPPTASGHYTTAVLLGLGLILVLGGGAYVGWRSHARHPHEPAAVPSSSASASPSSSASPATADIAFRVTPPSAALVVDGRDLAPGVTSIARPPSGRSVTVVARAPGYADRMIFVDYFTVSPVEMLLLPSATAVERPDAGVVKVDTPGQDIPRPDGPKPDGPKPPRPNPGIPANPY